MSTSDLNRRVPDKRIKRNPESGSVRRPVSQSGGAGENRSGREGRQVVRANRRPDGRKVSVKSSRPDPVQTRTARQNMIRDYFQNIVTCIRHKKYYDWSLLVVVLVLISFGLMMLYSTTAYMAEMSFGDDMHYFLPQARYAFLALVVALGVSFVDYHILKRYHRALYIVGLVAMCLVRTPLGNSSHGASRWINLGFISFQPAEIAKIAVIITMSVFIAQEGHNVRNQDSLKRMIGIGAIPAVIALVITNNLSTAIIIMAIMVGMLFVVRPKYRNFLIIAGVGLVLAALLVFVLYHADYSSETNFRLRRIMVWLHPEDFAQSGGYQTLQALYAIGSGGWFGQGIGNSIQKLGSVPEAQNDMIFSIICEELGIAGACVILILFGYLLYRIFFIAVNADDLLGSMPTTGVFIHFALQVIMNVAVVCNLLPNTGVTLPFISYGGTSLMFLMAEIGMVLSVARYIRFEDDERLI